MRLTIDSGEKYPHLFINEPVDDYGQRTAFDVPDDLGAAVLAAQKALDDAEAALLTWLGESPDSPMPRTNEVLRNFYQDDDV
jgi:hypothetical protein